MSNIFKSPDIAPLDTFLTMNFKLPKDEVRDQILNELFSPILTQINRVIALWNLSSGNEWTCGMLIEFTMPWLGKTCRAYIETMYEQGELKSKIRQMGPDLNLTDCITGLQTTQWLLDPYGETLPQINPDISNITQAFLLRSVEKNILIRTKMLS